MIKEPHSVASLLKNNENLKSLQHLLARKKATSEEISGLVNQAANHLSIIVEVDLEHKICFIKRKNLGSSIKLIVHEVLCLLTQHIGEQAVAFTFKERK